MSTNTIERRRLAERMNASEDDYEPGGVATPPAQTAATESFKFSPGQERWPPGAPGGLGGQWKGDGGPDVGTASGKKVVPAIIYKKHKDGAVVAQRGSRRLRWDAGSKKYTAEEREGGAWVEKQKLTKTAAYAELKDGDWHEESGDSDSPAPTPASTPAPTPTPNTGNRVEKLTPEERDAAEAELVDWNSPLREEYARAALNESTLGTTTYVARDTNGRLTGALAVRDFNRETAAEVDVDHPYAYVEFAGAREGSGAGTDLTRRAIEHALATDASALYLQATEESAPYWERQGFTDDPLDAGVELYGMDRQQMQKWLNERSSKSTTTEDTPPVPDSGTDVPPMSSETLEPDVPVGEPTVETGDSDLSEDFETPARKNSLDTVRRDPKIRTALHDKSAFMATHGFGGVPNDTILEALAKRAGFTHKPLVRDREAVDTLIESGSPSLLRAFRTEAARDNFTQGDYYGAIGTEGNGTYFHFRPHDYDPIYAAKVYDYGPGGADRPDTELAAAFDETVEKMYTRLRKRALIEQNRALENTLRYGEHAIRGALQPGTDIRSLRDDVRPAQDAYLAELQAERAVLTDPDEIAELDLWIKAMRDEGRFAAAAGIPAYYSTTSDELVVLDRGALVIQDEPPRLATADDLVPTSTSPSAPTVPETPTARFDSPTSAHLPFTESQREIDSRIRTAFRALQGRTDLPESHKEIVPGKSPQRLMRTSGYVGFADLREELSDIPRDELDAVLRKLVGDQSVVIVPENAQFGLLDRDHKAALNVGNQFKHWLKIMPEGLPPNVGSTEPVPGGSEISALIAATEVHTGAMVALVPTDEDAERLAVDGGEDADQLHVTLGYLGEAALIPAEVQHALIESVAQCVLDRPTIVGNAFALAAINPDTGVTASTGFELDEVDDLVAGGQEPCVALLLSGSQLPSFHEYVMRDVAQTFAAAGMEMNQQHSPWVAHLTLVYTPDADLSYFTDRIGPVTFDRVRLAFGGEVYDIPLGEDEHSVDSTMMEPSDREEGDDS